MTTLLFGPTVSNPQSDVWFGQNHGGPGCDGAKELFAVIFGLRVKEGDITFQGRPMLLSPRSQDFLIEPTLNWDVTRDQSWAFTIIWDDGALKKTAILTLLYVVRGQSFTSEEASFSFHIKVGHSGGSITFGGELPHEYTAEMFSRRGQGHVPRILPKPDEPAGPSALERLLTDDLAP